MVSVSGTIEYTGVGKNVGIETNPYSYDFQHMHLKNSIRFIFRF